MRFRGKSIRRKMVALLLVPLVSLTAIWGFATVLTGRGVAQLFTVSSLVEKIGYSTEDAVRVLQQERRQALVYLADPRASDALTALRVTRRSTDAAVSEIRKNAKDPDVRDGMDEGDEERLTAVLDAFDGINALRRSVEDGTVTRAQALYLYNRLVDPCYALLGALDGIDSVAMDKQARALLNVTRARELLSREDALLSSALVVGKLTREEIRDVSDLVAQRTLMYDVSLTDLPSSERERFERFWKNASTAPLRVAEQAVIFGQPGLPQHRRGQELGHRSRQRPRRAQQTQRRGGHPLSGARPAGRDGRHRQGRHRRRPRTARPAVLARPVRTDRPQPHPRTWRQLRLRRPTRRSGVRLAQRDRGALYRRRTRSTSGAQRLLDDLE
ncbi:hypothetical protein SCHAM137S_06662 [Streptomyces chartreusis]